MGLQTGLVHCLLVILNEPELVYPNGTTVERPTIAAMIGRDRHRLHGIFQERSDSTRELCRDAENAPSAVVLGRSKSDDHFCVAFLFLFGSARAQSLLVSSLGTDTVLQYDGSSGSLLGTFVSANSGGLDGPIGLTIGPDGNLYVADARRN